MGAKKREMNLGVFILTSVVVDRFDVRPQDAQIPFLFLKNLGILVTFSFKVFEILNSSYWCQIFVDNIFLFLFNILKIF